MKHIILFATFALFTLSAKGQNAQEIWDAIRAQQKNDTTVTDTVTTDTMVYDIIEMLADTSDNGGIAELVVPAEVGVMMKSHIMQNQLSKRFTGFRIQIASVNSAQKPVEELEAMRDKFEEDFPYIPAYLQYTVPDFKIRVGNYRSKLEAIPHLQKIRKLYPDCYVVKCEITFNELERLPLEERRKLEAELELQRLTDSINAANGIIPEL